MKVSLSLTSDQHQKLEHLLLPSDGKEAVAFLLCSSRSGTRWHRLIVREVCELHGEYYHERRSASVSWDTEALVPLLERAAQKGYALIKVHSHPNGFTDFSAIDDYGDYQLLPVLQAWTENDALHGSAIMLPDGKLLGRVISVDEELLPIEKIAVVGDDLTYWINPINSPIVPEFTRSHVQAFGEETFKLLSELSIAVIGCSGTGSVVIEQLARLGVGHLLLVDDDVIEERNLNRILNSTLEDAKSEKEKVFVLSNAINRMGLGTEPEAVPKSLWDPNVVKAVAECDVIFGCMDTVDGRYLLNRLATYYSVPYFDLGVRIVANPENREIEAVCGSVHYLQPGSSLMQREVFDMEQVRAAGLARTDPEAFKQNFEEGYIRGVNVQRAAVISLNMLIASLGVNELIARLNPYRDEPNNHYDQVEVDLNSMQIFTRQFGRDCAILRNHIGKGDCKPLLDSPELSEAR
jgi:hypothetical protein